MNEHIYSYATAAVAVVCVIRDKYTLAIGQSVYVHCTVTSHCLTSSFPLSLSLSTYYSIDTLDKMKTDVKRVEGLLNDKSKFREFWRWLFELLKEEPDRKTIGQNIYTVCDGEKERSAPAYASTLTDAPLLLL